MKFLTPLYIPSVNFCKYSSVAMSSASSLFVTNGGYDKDISNPYWQKMDFGFRVFLWDEKIESDTSLMLKYLGEVATEDNTPDAGYKKFYLKNIAVKSRQGMGVLPFYRFPGYMIRSDTGPIYSLKEFKTVRKWIKMNASRFKHDSKSITAFWEE